MKYYMRFSSSSVALSALKQQEFEVGSLLGINIKQEPIIKQKVSLLILEYPLEYTDAYEITWWCQRRYFCPFVRIWVDIV